MFNYFEKESKQQITMYCMYTKGGVYKKIEVTMYVDKEGLHIDCDDMLCVVRRNPKENGFRVFPYIEPK